MLLVVTDVAEGRSKLIVRGDRQSGYHMDVYEKANRELAPHKLHVSFSCLLLTLPCCVLICSFRGAGGGVGSQHV